MRTKNLHLILPLFLCLVYGAVSWSAPVTFNDAALLNAVKTQWEAATGGTLSDPPQDTELSNAAFTALDAKELGITDLTGLQACTSLTDLNLGMNQITSLTPIAGLTGLVNLDLGTGFNPMESDAELEPYFTGANLITDLSPLAGLVNVEYLSLMGNGGITDITALSTMDSLSILWFGANPISSFAPLSDVADTLQFVAFMNCGVDNADIPILNGLTNLAAMGVAFIAEPNLTDISGLTDINPSVFVIIVSPLTDISVITHYTNLEDLDLEEMPITALPDLSGLTRLKTIYFLKNTVLTDISGMANLTSLDEVIINECPVSDISALATCTGLRRLDISDNQITDIQPLLDNPNIANLQSIEMRNNPFTAGTPFCDENQLNQLQALAPSVWISHNAICGEAAYLTISVNGVGNTEPAPGVTAVPADAYTTVNAYIIEGSGYAFENWTGDFTSTLAYAQIFMDGDKSITANFVPGDWTLTTNKTGHINGRIWPDPGVYSYLDGQTAYVNAEGGDGAYFNGWSGDANGFTPNVQFTMNANKTLTANFVNSGYSLTLNRQGQGNITGFYNNGPYYFASGATFNLVAQAYSMGYRFDHWEGNLPAGANINDPVLPIVMDQDRAITAVFVLDVKILTIIIEGGGSTYPAGSPAPGTQHLMSTGQGTCINAINTAGVAFDHWSGDIGSANPYNPNLCVTMDQDRTLTAHFAPADWNLTLAVTGNGSTNPTPGVYGYVNGAQANFSAQLISGGDAFSGWTGDINSGSEQNTWNSVLMDRDRTVVANFVPGNWTLTLNTSGVGGGGTNPNAGSYAYLNGQTATVNAWSNGTAYFSGWTGDVTSNLPNIHVVMDGNKTLTANFASTGYILNVSQAGQGGVNIGGTHFLAAGMELVLTASTWNGWKFSEWTGDLPVGADANDPELPVLMDQNRSITAVFIQDTKTLTIIIDGPGSTDPAGSPDPGTQYDYISGQIVCVEALAGADTAFSYWSGDIGGYNPNGSNLCVTMDQDRSVTAHFAAADWTLTLAVSGNGTTDPVPGDYGYRNGAWVNFNAVLVSGGDAFSHWSGDIDTGDPQSFRTGATMDKDRTITANFVPGNWLLTLGVTGATPGDIFPDPGTYSYLAGQNADLYATTSSFSYFAGWSGDVEDDMPNIRVVMDGNKTLTANYASEGFILNISTVGNGWTNLPTTSYFAEGAEPVVKTNSQNGWTFDYWSGDLPAGADIYSPELPVLMDKNRSLTAHFMMEMRTLTIIIVGQGETSPAGGPEPGIEYSYADGSQVWVYAEPGMNTWAFSGWAGDIGSASATSPFLSLTMNQDRTIVANYVTADWTLTLGYTGNGSTWPDPGTYGYLDGASVEAVANIQNGGDAFNHWEGALEGADIYDLGQRFNIHGNMTLTAIFTPGDYTLTTTVAGGGTAEYVSHPAGTYQYMSGRNANLEVRPWPTTYWGGYSGDVNTFDYTHSLLMDGNKNVTITLGLSGYELVVSQTGGGLTEPSGAWRFVSGATPTIHAMDQSSALFDYWSGELPAGVDPNDRNPAILMDQHRTIIANFVQADWYLYLQVQGMGTIAPEPALYWYQEGDTFEVTATPGADTLFLHWTGNVPEGQDPASLTISGTMTQNREIIAVFVPQTVAVPELSGMTREQAGAALMSAGLTLGAVTQEYSSTVPAGQVIRQSPAAQTSVAYGSVVSIVISLGSCYTSIPNVEGLGTAEAQAALTTANLTTGAVTYEVSELVPEGNVISQNPVSGLVVECGTAVALVVSGTGPEGGEEGEGEGSGEGESGCHTADQDCNNLVNLSELLRVIQFFNSGGYHCESGTEDGFAPGLGDTNCTPHASDYMPQDWFINLSELLRIIQFFNSGGYHYCPGENTEDGFCPGVGAE